MNSINPHFVEKYQILYEKDPNSKVFAPLAEAYRKMGLLDQAYDIAKKGISAHPNFASGHLAYAKILLDRKILDSALIHLEKAIELAPENIQAHYLLAKTYSRQREHQKAIQAYKMLLFLSPNHAEAQRQLKKLESLTAEDYDKDLFSFNPIQILSPKEASPGSAKQKNRKSFDKFRQLERMLSLADAFIVRNDADKALITLKNAQGELGTHPEITKRFQMLKHTSELTLAEVDENLAEEIRPRQGSTSKVATLQKILQRINERR